MRHRWRAVLIAGLLASTLGVTAAGSAGVRPGDCAWTVKADPDRVNIAFPDEGAEYWATQVPLVPGAETVIQGRFPLARYFSFHAYEGSAPVDAVTDVDVVPSSGRNPFLPGAMRSKRGTYEVHVVPGPRPDDPAQRQPNTLYAGEGLNGEPQAAATVIYRLYLPEGDRYGRSGLPVVEHQLPGAGSAGPLPSCEVARPADDGTLNDAVRSSSVPAPSPGVAAQEPSWGVSRSRPQPNSVGPATVYTGNVFFANFDNEYLSLLVGRQAGEVVAFRAKAPTFPRTRGKPRMGTGQLRYWSFCTNDFPTTRYVACVADEAARLDGDGYVTVVISDAAHKPAGLRATDNWLPAGPYADYFILYRHMLPDSGFAEAVQRVPNGAEPATTMGAYYPEPVVCSRDAFESDRCGLP
jgi:hypothetical protein